MKRFILLLAALFIMGGAMAQNDGQSKPKEYVSVLLTFNSRQFPMDSLNAYGVKIQTRTGVTATALIPAENYQAFLMSGIAERVQPSTRVVLYGNEGEDNSYRPQHPQHPHHDTHGDVRPGHHGEGDAPQHGNKPCHHHGDKPCPHHGERPERGHDDAALDNEDARGFYLGILLGDSRNTLRIEKIDMQGTWYPVHGIDGELLLGYQFNRWFGIRTAAQFINKSYLADLTAIDGNVYKTSFNNLYIQAPLMADFSIGGRNTRLHVMLGGYCGYWMVQYRNGYIYSPNGTPGKGYKYGFEEGYNEHLDAGAAAGLGLTFRLSPACLLHLEGAYYYGLMTTTAEPNSTFNRTYTLDMGISYHF